MKSMYRAVGCRIGFQNDIMHKIISEEIGLFHYSDELLFADLSIPVSVCLINHFLQLLISHRLSELSCDSLEVLQGDLAGCIIIEEPESLKDLLSWVSLCNLASHQLHEICKLNDSFALPVHFRDHFLHFLLFWLKSKCPHRYF